MNKYIIAAVIACAVAGPGVASGLDGQSVPMGLTPQIDASGKITTHAGISDEDWAATNRAMGEAMIQRQQWQPLRPRSLENRIDDLEGRIWELETRPHKKDE